MGAEERRAEDSESWQVSPSVRAVPASARCHEVLLGHAGRDLRESQHRRGPWGFRVPDGGTADRSSFPSVERVVLPQETPAASALQCAVRCQALDWSSRAFQNRLEIRPWGKIAHDSLLLLDFRPTRGRNGVSAAGRNAAGSVADLSAHLFAMVV